ncbi:MAG: dipeptide epimerase [Dysgonomonas sp.]|nr:dipeptide epimerase [Dysgonomonas sp.]
MQSRRNFIKAAAITTGLAVSNPLSLFSQNNKKTISLGNSKMKLSFRSYDLQLRHVFTIANSSRTITPVVLTEIFYDGVTGYGEASLPPYLGETQASVTEFLKKVNLDQFSSPFEIEDILSYIDKIAENNTAAKASIDIALHDLVGKIMNQPWYKIWGLNPNNTPSTTFTIGMDTDEVVKEKTKEASPYNILKVKLGRGETEDKRMIDTIRSVSYKPIAVDANQGWKDKHMALDMILWLKEKGIVMIEQPTPKYNLDDAAWITERSPLPIFADESFQRLPDVLRLKGAFSGVNIKLMKCTGMHEAWKIQTVACAANMKVMIGCMVETSCAISAATQLSPVAEWADLDGNLLISNDCFNGVTVNNGKMTLNDLPGIGIKPIK